MPKIQGYEDHIQAQGGLNVQANPGDFGAQIGQATERFGGAVSDAAQQVHQYNETQDVTNVHVNMAKARAEWTQTMQDRANSAQPGDDSFAPTMMKDMADYFQQGAASANTAAGKRLWTTMSAQMTSEFGQRAIGVQGELAAKDAVNKYDTLLLNHGKTASRDPMQSEAAIADAKAAIDDPNGMFARVSQPVRDKFKQQIELDINRAAVTGILDRQGGADALLRSIAPDVLAQFKPAENLVRSQTAPGATASVSKGAMKWAPDVQNAAARKGLNSNILLAQLDAESGGNPGAVSPVGAAGLSQFMPGTAKQYGVDVTNPQSSINGQAAFMSDLVKKYGGDYRKALAAYNWGPGNVDRQLSIYGTDWANHLPAETTNYVAKIMRNAGAVSPTNATAMANVALAPTAAGGSVAAAPTTSSADDPNAVLPTAPDNAPRASVSSSIPQLNALPWEMQHDFVNKAVQMKHLEMSLENHAREMADYQLKKQQETAMTQYINRIIDPANQGGTPTAQEVSANPILSAQQRQHVADYALARQRELAAAAENKTNPEEFRRLFLQIHAADDDPTKTYSFDPVMQSYAARAISTNEMLKLRTEVEQMKDGNGSNFAKSVARASQVVHDAAMGSLMLGKIDPAAAANAWYAFDADLRQQIEAKRKAGEDPRPLLDPGSREYLMKPERLATFGITAVLNPSAPSSTLAASAAKVKATLPTFKDYETLKKGDQYTDPQGNVRTKG